MPGEKSPLRPAPGGVVVSLKVRPSAGRASLEKSGDGSLRLHLKSPPEKGKANREAEAFLKRLFGRQTRLLSGKTGRRKEFVVAGLDIETAKAIIEKATSNGR